MRPRLVFLRDLVADLGGAARARSSRRRRGAGRQRPSGGDPPGEGAGLDEQRSAEEVRRRLDQTRERLKREIPAADEPDPRAG